MFAVAVIAALVVLGRADDHHHADDHNNDHHGDDHHNDDHHGDDHHDKDECNWQENCQAELEACMGYDKCQAAIEQISSTDVCQHPNPMSRGYSQCYTAGFQHHVCGHDQHCFDLLHPIGQCASTCDHDLVEMDCLGVICRVEVKACLNEPDCNTAFHNALSGHCEQQGNSCEDAQDMCASNADNACTGLWEGVAFCYMDFCERPSPALSHYLLHFNEAGGGFGDFQ